MTEIKIEEEEQGRHKAEKEDTKHVLNGGDDLAKATNSTNISADSIQVSQSEIDSPRGSSSPTSKPNLATPRRSAAQKHQVNPFSFGLCFILFTPSFILSRKGIKN